MSPSFINQKPGINNIEKAGNNTPYEGHDFHHEALFVPYPVLYHF